MLAIAQNSMKITARILGGSDYFVSKQASKQASIYYNVTDAGVPAWSSLISRFGNMQLHVPKREIC